MFYVYSIKIENSGQAFVLYYWSKYTNYYAKLVKRLVKLKKIYVKDRKWEFSNTSVSTEIYFFLQAQKC